MAKISDNQKLDMLWKALQYGVSSTGTHKSPYEELSRTEHQIQASKLWRNDGEIPTPAAVVPDVTEAVNIRLVAEPSVTNKTVWVAVETYESGITEENRLTDFVSPKFDPSYEIRVYMDAAKTQPLYNSDSDTKWVFDYSAGILWFPISDFEEEYNEVPFENVYITGFRYVGQKGLPPTFEGDYIDLIAPLTNAGGFTGGYVPGWVAGETKISDAMDQMNRALLDFIPQQPIPLSEIIIDMPGAIKTMHDANIVLSSGATTNTGALTGVPIPGQMVERVVGMNLETDYVGPFGDGASGALSVDLNGNSIGHVVLGAGDNSGIYNSLDLNQDSSTINDTKRYYETLKARAIGVTMPIGLNGLNLRHTKTGSTNMLWLVRENTSVMPEVTNTGVSAEASNPIVYSSGVPHYGRGSILLFDATVDKLATNIHLDSRNIEFQTFPKEAGPTVWAYPGSFSLPSVLVKDAEHIAEGVGYVITDYDGIESHGTVSLRVLARNTNGKHVADNDVKINYMRDGTVAGMGDVTESNVIIENLGVMKDGDSETAYRVNLSGGGDMPEMSVRTSDTFSSPVGTVDIAPVQGNMVPAVYEAKVVGGQIIASRENYSSYLPAGPDYSSHNMKQYITYIVQRSSVSNMKIHVEGTHSGIWVGLPGLLDMNKTSNGWMDANKLYEGWGTPGKDVNNGCAVGVAANGGPQTVEVTFGQASSSTSNDNIILVRFALDAGQAITGLKFSGVSK